MPSPTFPFLNPSQYPTADPKWLVGTMEEFICQGLNEAQKFNRFFETSLSATPWSVFADWASAFREVTGFYQFAIDHCMGLCGWLPKKECQHLMEKIKALETRAQEQELALEEKNSEIGAHKRTIAKLEKKASEPRVAPAKSKPAASPPPPPPAEARPKASK